MIVVKRAWNKKDALACIANDMLWTRQLARRDAWKDFGRRVDNYAEFDRLECSGRSRLTR